MDSHERPPLVVRASSGIATVVLFGQAEVDPRQARTAVFPTPSDAILAAVSHVAHGSSDAYSAVLTGEYSPETNLALATRLHAVAAVAEPGQVLVSLAAQEIARPTLSLDYGFRLLGSAHVGAAVGRVRHVERLFLVEHPSLSRPIPRARPQTAPRRTLAFFGRRRELEELEELIDLSRLVSIIGVTGVGKSSLLHRFVTECGDRFPDGVGQIDLSGISPPAGVAQTIRLVLDTPKLPGEDSLDAVIAHLRRRRFLLVLDNAEHVCVETAQAVSAILDACGDVGILVGSQRPLGLPGEARFRLGGLETPESAPDARTIQEYDAVSLFVDRAQLMDPAFRLSDADSPFVAEICRRLDGIPLAIELAAAKTPTFSARQLLTRLDDRLDLFTDPSTGRTDRHRSLRTSLNWATTHVGDEARRLLGRLAVFEGGFSIDQAIEVCAEARLPEAAFIVAFEELLDGSLLAAMDGTAGEKRFRLSSSVRRYAKELLQRSGEAAFIERRHDEWCARLCEQASTGLEGDEQLMWLERLDAHMEDVRTLVERQCALGGDGALAVRAVLQIHRYYFLRHFLMDGFRLASRVVEARACQATPERSRIENFVSVLAGRLGDPDAAREYALRSIGTARTLGDRFSVARGRMSLGMLYEDAGAFSRARRHFMRAADVFRTLGMTEALAKALINVSAIEATEEALLHLSEVEALLVSSRNLSLVAYFHQNCSHVAIKDSRHVDALFHAGEAISILSQAQELSALGTAYRNAAHALSAMGEYRLAARFAGANRKIVRQLDQRVRPYEATAFESLIERLRNALGDEEFDQQAFMGAESSVSELVTLLVRTR